jgi:hypothetical protein
MTSDGSLYGDNTDVRPPSADELWHGGFISGSGGSSTDSMEPVRFTLDGVFFVDGGFAGPNRLGSWEQTVFAAAAYLECAALAREARRKGTPPSEFFLQVQVLTGQTDPPSMPPPPPPIPLDSGPPNPESIRKYAVQKVGWRILRKRETMDDEANVARLESWADAPAPRFHKL